MPAHLHAQMTSMQKGRSKSFAALPLTEDQTAAVQFLLKKLADAESRASIAEHRAQRAEAALAALGHGPRAGGSFKGRTLQQQHHRQAPGLNIPGGGSPTPLHRAHRGVSAPPARSGWVQNSPRKEMFDTAVSETPMSADAMLTGLRQGMRARPASAYSSIAPNRKLDASHLTGQQAGLNSTGLIYEAHRVFTLSDSDRNGTLDVQEMQRMQRMLTQIDPDLYPAPLTPAFANKVISAAIDTDGDGVVDRGEWIAFVTQQAKASGERPMLKLMQLLGKQLDKCWR